MIGLILPTLTLSIGLIVGATSAFVGGWLDELIQRIVEVFMAFPLVIAAITLGSILTPRLQDRQLSALIALTVFGWASYARLIRGEVLAIKSRDYVLAARVIGASPTRILVRHILPNALNPLYMYIALDIGTSVLVFSGLSFLGLGSAEDYADWGSLLSSARNWIPDLFKYWYIVVFPGTALMLFSLAWNLIGDALRDALDPRMRGRITG
jgi:peptide/nickel transport system permease protein